MKSFEPRATLAIVIAVLTSTTAPRAATLQITGWALSGGVADVVVDAGAGLVGHTFSVGGLTGKLDGSDLSSPLYSLDIFHSFNLGSTWTVNPLHAPSSSFNAGDASWVYSHYGTGIGSGEAYKAAGVQLALWEISHDQGWRTHFSVDTWYRSGKFQYTGGATEMRDYASLILDQVYNNTGAAGGHATYYQSLPQDRAAYGQGYLGAIPEPTTMVLLGVGLLVGGVLRKRR